MSQAEKTEATNCQRERYLAALLEVQRQLLAAKEGDYYPAILKLLGEVSGASRVYVFENEFVPGRLIVSQRAEWCAPGVKPEIDNPLMQNEVLERFPRWVPLLLGGETITALTAELPEGERSSLEAQDIKAIAQIPIVAEGEFLGFLGFDNCVEARIWEPDEIDLLRSAATAILLWHDRKRTKEALRQSEVRFRTIFESAAIGSENISDEHAALRDRQRAQAEREASMSLLQATLESTADGLLVIDQERNSPVYNRKFIQMWGIPEALLLPERGPERLRFLAEQTQDPEGFITRIWEILRECAELEVIDYVELKDGRVFERYSQPQWQGNQIIGRVWSFRDISDARIELRLRQRAEEALRQSEVRFRAVFESAATGICLSGLDGTILKINPALQRMLGYSEAEFLWQKFINFSYPDDIAPDLALNHELIQGLRDSYQLEKRYIRKDGQVFWARITVSVVKSGGEAQFTVALVEDISDRKQSEEALKQALAAAEVANRAKSQFLSSMSHELRTPLNVILGFTQLMARNGSLYPQQQGYLDTIGRSGEHLLALINDVLEMSKIEVGRTTLHENNFDLYGLLNRLKQMLRLKVESKRLQLSFELATDLPRYIRSDEGKLRQVLMNLLGNAIKFTQAGSVTLRVRGQVPGVRCQGSGVRGQEEKSSTLGFEVEDTGPGIAPEELEHLFDPFVQTEVGRNSQEGTGLGLSISRQFVRLLGGEIVVTSQVGVGSLFRFEIPVFAIAAEQIQAQALTQQVIGLEPGQPQYRILVAEDKWSNREFLLELLAPIGFEVQVATNGEEAIALWQSWAPHLIWMDIQMPLLDGYEATKRIKAADGQAPVIIALTGSAFEEERVTALSVGCDDFVCKPVRAEVIFEKMAEHLGVRYTYAGEMGRWGDGEWDVFDQAERSPQPPTSPAPDLPLTPSHLAVMPPGWIQQLHQAASRVNAKQLLKLIEQIPESNAHLAEALTHLVHNFCFEEIIELTQGHLNE